MHVTRLCVSVSALTVEPCQVQGVFFRKYTEAAAQKMGVVGWVMNTRHGTVAGEAQGRPLALQQFKVRFPHCFPDVRGQFYCNDATERSVS